MSNIEKLVSARGPEIGERLRRASLGLVIAATAIVLCAIEESRAQTATVDRATGAISLTSGATAELKGYTLKSDSGLLSPDTWNSLEDQSIPGWGEANPRVQQLSELNLEMSSTLNAGDSWDLGNAYAGGPTPPRDEDVTLEYWVADGSVLTGTVNYTGPANDLVLNVNEATGAATLQNLSALVGDFDVTGYSIFSDSGSLNVDGFSGIGEAGWVSANPQSTALAELNLEGSKVFSEGTVVSLGNIFDPNGTQDLTLEFTDVALNAGTVQYDVFIPCVPVNALLGDLDGDRTVGFPDFLTLSANFGLDVTRYEDGDIDCDGSVGFPDFLTLSANFGQTLPGAAAVPEPSMGILTLIGLVGLFRFRRSRNMQRIVGMCLVVGLLSTASQQSWAEDFDSRFIRLDPAGTNNQINNTTEARDIVSAVPVDAEAGDAVGDYIVLENLSGKVEVVDLAGGAGNFGFDDPYLNGVNDATMDDFLQFVSGTLEIPEGDWAIGFGSDDGGFLNMPSISFVETFNENGSVAAGDGEVLFNGTRGHGWTGGNFTVPAGGITTAFEAGFFERGGGDSFEVAVIDQFAAGNADFPDFGFELEDGVYDGWVVTGDPFDPFLGNKGDFNLDGTVDAADWMILSDNFGTGASLTQGDINFDRQVDLVDASEFHAAFTGGGAAAAVPEPASVSLLLMAVGCLLGMTRNKRR